MSLYRQLQKRATQGNVVKVGVIGAGQMGNGIALIITQAGIEVVMRDIEQGFVDKGLNSIKK